MLSCQNSSVYALASLQSLNQNFANASHLACAEFSKSSSCHNPLQSNLLWRKIPVLFFKYILVVSTLPKSTKKQISPLGNVAKFIATQTLPLCQHKHLCSYTTNSIKKIIWLKTKPGKINKSKYTWFLFPLSTGPVLCSGSVDGHTCGWGHTRTNK